jgi:hypothetical protein
MSLGARCCRFAHSGRLGALALVIAIAVSACISPSGPAVTRDAGGNPTSRDAFAWPFAASSPWNVPIGSNAQYSQPTDPSTQALLAPRAGINAANWSHPVYLASWGDPVRYLGSGANVVQIHVPDSAAPSGPPGGDAQLNIVDPTRHVVDESWRTSRVFAANLASGSHVRVDLRGDGLVGGTAAGMSAIGGLIRTWELQDHDIRHVLAIAVPASSLALGPVWPARSQDSWAPGRYLGALHMGSLVAIPPDVNVAALGLSAEGLAIARALQNYGAYLVNTAGQTSLVAEPSAEGLVRSARADMNTIGAQLRVVIDNGPGSVGGGGAPRMAYAPPFND